MDTSLRKNIQSFASRWILSSFAVGNQIFNILSDFFSFTGKINMWGITIEVSKIMEPDTKNLTNETTEVVVHISPELKALNEQPCPIRKENTPKMEPKRQDDLDKITIDLGMNDQIPPVQQQFKGKEQLIKEVTSKNFKSDCLPSSLIFLGIFLMFISVVIMAYWLTKK